jgi:hypothetical protein
MPRPKRRLTGWELSALRLYVEDADVSVRVAAALLGLPRDEAFRAARIIGLSVPSRRASVEETEAGLKRRCRSCGKMRLLSRFRRDATKPLGRGYVCRRCLSDPVPWVASAIGSRKEERTED